MFYLFLVINILSYFLAILLRRVINIKSDVKTKFYTIYNKFFWWVFVAILVYKLILNIFFKIYLIGFYTDIVLGVVFYFLLDIFFISAYPSVDLKSKIYNRFRVVYVIFNATRLIVVLFAVVIFKIFIPATYPIADTYKYQEKPIFVYNKYYLQGFSYWGFEKGLNGYDHICDFRIYKKFGLFMKLIHQDGYCMHFTSDEEVVMKDDGSLYVYGVGVLIRKENEKYYYVYGRRWVEL